jgi:hypothetical protein
MQAHRLDRVSHFENAVPRTSSPAVVAIPLATVARDERYRIRVEDALSWSAKIAREPLTSRHPCARGRHEYSMAMADMVAALDEAQLRDLAYYIARFH